MSDDRKQQIEHIQALLAERRKVERWLEGLETRRSSAPMHVVQRVEADYRAKFDEAQTRLSNETGAVRTLVGELAGALAAQERAVGAKVDERAESELRAAVGEFAQEEWEQLRATLDAAVATLEEERGAIRRELDTMRALLDDAAPTSDVAAPDPSPAPQGETVAGPSLSEQPGTDAGHAPAPVEPSLADAAATAGLNVAAPVAVEPAVAETRAAELPVAAASGEPVAPVVAPAAASVDAAPTVDELAFLRTVLGGSTPQATQRPVDSPPRGTFHEAVRGPRQTPLFSRSTGGAAKPAVPELFGMNQPPMPMPDDHARESGGFQRLSGQFGALGGGTPRNSEAVKSLKCGECGTLNYPTEWYCEKCGGELAAF